MELFNIATGEGIKEVNGVKIKIENIICFIFREGLFYNVSHFYTGMKMADDADAVKVIEKIKEKLKENNGWLKTGKRILKDNGFKYPINND